jgi:hypothetical protein
MPNEQTVTTDPPEDFAAFEAWRENREETPAAGDEPAQPAPASEPVVNQEEDKGKGVQKRIDALTREKHDALRRADEAERKLAESQGSRPATENAQTAKPADEGKPKLEDCETIEEFQEKLTDWKLDQRDKARAAETQKQQAQQGSGLASQGRGRDC